MEFVVWKITPTRAKIGPRIAQNVDQLQTHSVAFPHPEHVVFASRRKLWQMTKTEPGPKFSRAPGNQISVFVELRRRFQGDDLFRILETLEIEELAAINLFKHCPHFFTIQDVALFEPIQTWLERFNQRALVFVFLQRRQRRAKIENRVPQCFALNTTGKEMQ